MHLSQASFTGDRQGLGDRDYCIAGESSRERAPLPKGTEKEKFPSENQIHRSKQRELSRCLQCFGVRRPAIANLRSEEEEE